jgi:hypothetical protein
MSSIVYMSEEDLKDMLFLLKISGDPKESLTIRRSSSRYDTIISLDATCVGGEAMV